ncbi:hypothetical protein [Methylobacterium sp. 22177]|uniref:hypothetical protein n=1 Tax=Methylobacterium sp. 22177 TaxID=3453885 RepID=UPI003F865636
MAEPAEGSLHKPARLQHDEALLVRLLLDDAVTHAMEVTPVLAGLGREGAVEYGQAQARPLFLAVIEGQKRVAILHVGRHDGQCQDVALDID